MIPLLCSCGDAALTQPTLENCEQKFGQVQKIIFQRTYQSAGTKNKFVIATANPNTLASWTALKSATDNTKVVVSPFVIEPVNEAGEAITEGGGNASLNGIPTVEGTQPSTFNAKTRNLKQSVIEDWKKIMCDEVSVFLIDNYGQIGGLTNDHGTPAEFTGIPIDGQFISDLALGGLEAANKNMINWFFKPNWSNKFHIVQPSDFDSLTEI